jgi:two-component system response regulator FixJ
MVADRDLPTRSLPDMAQPTGDVADVVAPAMRILVIEDDAAMARRMDAILTADGAAIDLVGLGKDGIKQGKRHLHTMIIIDLLLPDLHGLTVLRKLRAANVHTPALIVSADPSAEMRTNCFDSGADDYMTTPFRGTELVARVHAVEKRIAEHALLMSEARDALAKLAPLTAREREVLNLIAVGRSNKLAAYELGISTRTVEVHRARIMNKMNVRTLAEVIRAVLAAARMAGDHGYGAPASDRQTPVARRTQPYSAETPHGARKTANG